ncbi:MAG: hypothetical protein ACOZE5_18475 [Verrucomicrobiota bacterium]
MWREAWLRPVVVFGVVTAAQLGLVAAAGTDIPFHDQWDVEGRGLYPAVRDGSVTVADLFRPHNEHRIVWTHLLNLALFRLNGQWDPLVQLAVDALLHAAVAALLAAVLACGRSRGAGWLLALVVMILALPLTGWHNALWGFQSQVYFVMLFSLAAFSLPESSNPSPARVLGGWLAAGAAMLAMGPGLAVPAVLAAGWFLRRMEGRAPWREIWPLALALALAWGLHHPVPQHDGLRAGSIPEFFLALGRMLGWPHTGQPWAALILNTPLAIVAGGRLLKRRSPAVGEGFVVLLAGWTLVLALGAAWARGGGAEFRAGVPSRYADFTGLLPAANAWCAITLLAEAPPRWRASVRLVAASWGVFLFAGWLGLSAEAVRGIVLPRSHDRDAPARLIREFQRDDDPAVFAGQPRLLVPHPDASSVRVVLRDSRMQGALPPSLQPDKPLGPLSRAVRTLLGR